jgi:hypothetical protein
MSGEKGGAGRVDIERTVAYGRDAGRGNLLGIQPYLRSPDYASGETLYTRLSGYLDVARQREWLNDKTIVVLPEHTGTWLVAAGEGARVVRATTIESAMRALAIGRPLATLGALVRSALGLAGRPKDVAKASLFQVKAKQMADAYHGIFSRLARTYGATIVAGSIVLPAPRVTEGRLITGRGALYNVSAVYRPDGTPYPKLSRKAFPIEDELGFTAPAPVGELPVYPTPAGRLGVLVCADSWHPEPYQVLGEQGVELVAVPSFLSLDEVWDRAWRGYADGVTPADVDTQDLQRLTEGQAWLRYSMTGRGARTGIRHGMNVFLRGDLWDLGSDGHTLTIRDGEVLQAEHVEGAAIVNSWL